MSRLSTQSQAESMTFRLNMITTNIARIHAQNSKLQEVLTYRPQFAKLKQIATISAQNWHNLAALAQKVQGLSKDAMDHRSQMQQTLNKRSQYLNYTIVSDIQKTKTIIVGLQTKIEDLKARERLKIYKELQHAKNKEIERANKTKEDCLQLLAKIEKKYVSSLQKEIETHYQTYQAEQQTKYYNCRVSLGHLENLAAYFHWKKQNNNIQDISLEDTFQNNVESISHKLQQLEMSQRRVKGQVDWMKSKVRKQKSNSKKGKQSRYQPQQMASLAQLGFGINNCEYQLKGLDKICGQKSRRQNRPFTSQEVQKLAKIQQRLKLLKTKEAEYSQFYIQFF